MLKSFNNGIKLYKNVIPHGSSVTPR